jgi:hypothetical protein
VDLEWNKLGRGPTADEIEVTVMGPGFGESIVIHIGAGEWMIVDSCKEHGRQQVAPLRYLESIGVDPTSSVKIVAVTHWDQDHVKGIGDVVKKCTAAEFVCAKAFVKDEFQDYLEYYAIGKQDRGVKDIRDAFVELFESQRTVRQAIGGRLHLKRIAGIEGALADFSLTSLSPSDTEHDLFLQSIASQLPSASEPLRAAVARTPNLASVVLALNWNDCAVLLGADMEHRNELDRGWNAAVGEGRRAFVPPAGLVKIPHHGSVNAHNDRMWNELLTSSPISVIAPFGKGKGDTRPPTESDIARVKARSSTVFVTAPHVSSKSSTRNAAITRGLREGGIQTRTLKRPMGLVRFRRKANSQWGYEMFGPAFVAA